jgi:hypothetical protein
MVVMTITGVGICPDCIAHRTGIPGPRVDDVLSRIARTIMLSVTTRACAACLKTTTTYCLDGADGNGRRPPKAVRPPGTQYAILNFLGQHPGKRFCADCVAATLFPGKNIDVAMRQVEGNGVHRRHGACSACGKLRLVASLPGVT